MKTMVFLAMVLVAEFFVFGVPSSWGEWTHGLAVGVVGTCFFFALAWRHYDGRD